ncbi:glycoside hydrolase family 65 protein [Iamia sp. SCSIO 61187]|uniref:glycoside hydrolase family 65 protein n=1 Tax=Iamia sp. SCSIO 61187 TaxID=2722752 RepID=UPI001C633E92|nr:glycosyl hydrolase family 65 protein [Iamia sp. SCSIO 61187]
MGGDGTHLNDPGLISRTGWAFTFEGIHPEVEGRREALCTLGNGYMGTRGAAAEAVADGVHYPGTYVAGVYNRLTTEMAGARIEHESLVNLPNWLPLTYRGGPSSPADGRPAPWFGAGAGDVLEMRQTLDMKKGTLVRHLRVRDEAGRTTQIDERRIVSMDDPHIAAIEQVITPLDWSGRLEVRSSLDGRVSNTNVVEDRLLANQHLAPVDIGWSEGGIDWLEVDTSWSHVRTALAARTHMEADGKVQVRFETSSTPELVSRVLSCQAVEGRPVKVEKVVAVYNGRDNAVGRPLESARQALVGVGTFDTLLYMHELAWKHLWERCEIDVVDDSGDESVIAAVRLHAFHVMQSAAPHVRDLDASVTARGLHGEGYRGHIFWDELFVFPFLNFRFPDTTRALLRYRAHRLPAARRQARELGQLGARFPWQSGADGTEQTPSQLWNPRSGRWMPDNSRRQHHVGLAVVWNVWQYHQATGDYRFLLENGTELLVEQARFWTGMATQDTDDGRYHIRGVMGPDEYHDGYPGSHDGIDDNAYTNVLVSWLLQRVLEVRRGFKGHQAEVQLWERLGVTQAEADHWDDVSRHLHVPFHDGIISQFAGWEDLDEIDWDDYRARYGNIGRLDLILEAEGDTTNRYKLAKQADVLMLFYLMSPDELYGQLAGMGYELGDDMVDRTIEYYIERTAHGSTLSRIVYAWVTARVDPDRSWELFREALAADIDDTQGGTTPEGIHLGAMAGSLDLLQRCYSGLELRGEQVWFDPHLPPALENLAFDIVHHDRTLSIELDHDTLRVEVEPGPAVPVQIGAPGGVWELRPGEVLEVALKP